MAFPSIYWSPSNGIGLLSLHINIGGTGKVNRHGNLLWQPIDIGMLTICARVTDLPPYTIAFTHEILMTDTWQCTTVFMVKHFRIWFIKHCLTLSGPSICWCITYYRHNIAASPCHTALKPNARHYLVILVHQHSWVKLAYVVTHSVSNSLMPLDKMSCNEIGLPWLHINIWCTGRLSKPALVAELAGILGQQHMEYNRWQTSIRHAGWHDDVWWSTTTTSLLVKEYMLLNPMNIPLHMPMHLIYWCTWKASTQSMLMDNIIPFTTYAGARDILVSEHQWGPTTFLGTTIMYGDALHMPLH